MRQTKADLIQQIVGDEPSVSEVLALSQYTFTELRAELRRRERNYAAACRREERKWCPKCRHHGCRNLMHQIVTIDPWPTPVFSSIPKTRAPGMVHEWLTEKTNA